MPRLVAMSRSGEILVTENDGRTYLHLPTASGGVREIDADLADQHITRADLSRMDEVFDSWEALDERVRSFVSEFLAAPELDTTEWDEVDIRDMMATAERFVANRRVDEASRLLRLLLGLEQVRSAPTLHDEILAQQEAITSRAAVPTRRFVSQLLVAVDAKARWRKRAA